MNDLLNEDDFLQKPLHPWKTFILFSIISAVLNIGLLYSVTVLEIYLPELVNPILYICTIFSAPLFAVLSIFSVRNMRNIKPKLRFLGTATIYVLSYLAFITPIMIAHFTHEITITNIVQAVAGLLALYAVNYGIISLIMHLIIKKKNKHISNNERPA